MSQRTRFLATARNETKKRFALFSDNWVEENKFLHFRKGVEDNELLSNRMRCE